MKQLKKRNLPASPYYYLKCAPGASAARIVELYYGLPKHLRNLAPIEAYCLAARVNTVDALDMINRAAQMVSRQMSATLAAVTHPQVVEKTIEMALTDEGIDDRMVLHKATGFIPMPSGPRTTVNVAASASAQSAAPVIVAAPPPEQTIRRLVDRFNDARALPPAPPAEVIDQLPQREAVPVSTFDESEDDD
jgi:hypothetical protein